MTSFAPSSSPHHGPPLKVLFDAQIFRQQRYGGISRYCCELTTRLADEPGVQPLIVAPHHRNEYLPALPPQLVVGWHMKHWKRFGKLSRFLARRVEARTLERQQPDLIHATYYWASPLAHSRAKRVLTVYDMIHERFPEHFPPGEPTAAAKKRAVAEADHVICISHSTRRDLVAMLGVPEHKVSVTHLAAQMVRPAGAPAGLADQAPYLLYVGDRGGYKNFIAVVKALCASAAMRDLRRVCFCGCDLRPEEWAAIDAAGLARARLVQQHGDDTVLAGLYAGALCFVYPSLYEGFGIPPLEAMQCDCPVACSNTSSIPEVVGDAAELFDPHDVDAIRTALERVALSPTRRAELVALGRAQAQRFSWARCASETLAVYRRVLDRSSSG